MTDVLRGVLAGDPAALGRALSLVERGDAAAEALVREAWPHGGRAHTVGITGAPGAGKSTLTSALVGAVRKEDDARVAVLAVDPSSPLSGGAILGDRIRMREHTLDASVFVRSMATRGHLGGLSVAAPQAIRLLDAGGWDWILVETVGVGQVEVDVAGAADTTIVVVNPGWGDTVQTNKAGLLEVADVFVVNKADRDGAESAARDLEAMLEMTGRAGGGWAPPVVLTVAPTGVGVPAVRDAVLAHRAHARETGLLERRRAERLAVEVRTIAVRLLERHALDDATGSFDDLHADVVARRTDPFTAARRLIAAAGASR